MSNTAEAETFVILEETAIAKGVRRVSGVTRGAAIEAIHLGKSKAPQKR